MIFGATLKVGHDLSPSDGREGSEDGNDDDEDAVCKCDEWQQMRRPILSSRVMLWIWRGDCLCVVFGL